MSWRPNAPGKGWGRHPGLPAAPSRVKSCRETCLSKPRSFSLPGHTEHTSKGPGAFLLPQTGSPCLDWDRQHPGLGNRAQTGDFPAPVSRRQSWWWRRSGWRIIRTFPSLWPWLGGRTEQEELWLALRCGNSLGGTREGLPHRWLAQPRDAQPAFAA